MENNITISRHFLVLSTIVNIVLSKISVPVEALRKYYVVQRYSLPILMVVLYVLPGYLHFDPLGIYLDATAGNLAHLLLGW